MLAMNFRGPFRVRIDRKPDPEILHAEDAIVRVTRSCICGSDLHLYHGLVPDTRVGSTFGHEFIGVVEAVGPGVTKLKVGDQVIVPFNIACGTCAFCKQELFGNCHESNPEATAVGGLFGYTDLYGGYSGGQAEYVRVPKANVGPKIIPDGLSDDEVLFLTDIFPTGWSAVEWGEVKGGETVVIFGSGPVGLMAQKSAWLHGAKRVIAVDPLDYRLNKAKEVNKVEVLNAHDEHLMDKIRDMTNGRGADVTIDAVGTEAERSVGEKLKAVINLEKGSIKVIDWCTQAVRRGGVVSVVGVYGNPYDNFPIHRIFDKGLTMRFGQSYVHRYIDQLFDLVQNKKVVLDDIITHHLPLSEATKGYDMFKHKKNDCVKVVLKP